VHYRGGKSLPVVCDYKGHFLTCGVVGIIRVQSNIAPSPFLHECSYIMVGLSSVVDT
jgi:hypothetical protein